MVSMAQVTDSPQDTAVNGRDDAATGLCNVSLGVTAGPSAPYAAVVFYVGTTLASQQRKQAPL